MRLVVLLMPMIDPGYTHPETARGSVYELMWKLMDKEMDLKACERYTWDPEDDPFEAESALWSQHYFFFSNKDRKRVCYLNVLTKRLGVSLGPQLARSSHRKGTA
jgi:hypothetical protein